MGYKIYSNDPVTFAIDYDNGIISYLNKADHYIEQSGDYVYIKKTADNSIVIGLQPALVTIPLTTSKEQLYTALFTITDCTRPDYDNMINTNSRLNEMGFLLMGG